jgi:hypothetical protein
MSQSGPWTSSSNRHRIGSNQFPDNPAKEAIFSIFAGEMWIFVCSVCIPILEGKFQSDKWLPVWD